jgi:hypothetical protein
MKYWLLIFFFSPEGHYIDKKEILTLSQEECDFWKKKVVGPTVKVQCVSDDHYQGIKKDADVEYD